MHTIGIDIGGTQVKAAVVDAAGTVLLRRSEPTREGREALVRLVRGTVDAMDAALGAKGVRAETVGLAAPGLVAANGQSIAWMRGRLEALEGLDWALALGEQRTVWMLNDGHAATLAEAWLGAARGSRHVLMITLGTGVGGGIVADGRLLGGHLGRAGHVGHICLDPRGERDIVGTPGSLENHIGECTIAARSDGRFHSTEQLLRAAMGGDEQAGTCWRRMVRHLACGLVSLINVIDPQVIVIGGGVAQAGEMLFDALREEMDKIEWRPTDEKVRIVPAMLGPDAGAIGAARYAMQCRYDAVSLTEGDV